MPADDDPDADPDALEEEVPPRACSIIDARSRGFARLASWPLSSSLLSAVFLPLPFAGGVQPVLGRSSAPRARSFRPLGASVASAGRRLCAITPLPACGHNKQTVVMCTTWSCERGVMFALRTCIELRLQTASRGLERGRERAANAEDPLELAVAQLLGVK